MPQRHDQFEPGLYSIEWRDLSRYFQSLCFAEGSPQLILMNGGPFDDESSGTWWKVPLNQGQRLNVHYSLASTVNRMKVGRWMIPIIHLDNDAVEP